MRSTPEEVRGFFDYAERPNFPPRAHINPTEPIAIVRASLDATRHFQLVRWGFIPSWVKEIRTQPLINARSETIYEKPSFKNAIRRRRCLIPTDGFFEWQDLGAAKKQAWFIHREDEACFAFAGIYEHWLGADGSEIESAAIVTCEPVLPLSAFHDRSPVVIAPQDFDRWLGPDERVSDLFKPPPEDFWVMDKVASPRARAEKPNSPKPQMDLL